MTYGGGGGGDQAVAKEHPTHSTNQQQCWPIAMKRESLNKNVFFGVSCASKMFDRSTTRQALVLHGKQKRKKARGDKKRRGKRTHPQNAFEAHPSSAQQYVVACFATCAGSLYTHHAACRELSSVTLYVVYRRSST